MDDSKTDDSTQGIRIKPKMLWMMMGIMLLMGTGAGALAYKLGYRDGLDDYFKHRGCTERSCAKIHKICNFDTGECE